MRFNFYQKSAVPFYIVLLIVLLIWLKKSNFDINYLQIITDQNQISDEKPGQCAGEFCKDDNIIEERSNVETRIEDETNFEKRNAVIRQMFRNETDLISSVCSSLPTLGPPVRHDNLMLFSLNPTSKLLMCRTGKHGSTTWAQNFVKMYNRWDSGRGQPQLKLRALEEKAGINKAKKRRIVDAINVNNDISADTGIAEEERGYLSFFVCRNPMEKLQSVFKYVRDMRRKVKKFRSKIPPALDRSLGSWDSFLHFVSNIKSYEDGRLGILTPLTLGCNPCINKYDAVIKMETFDQDSRKILTSSGLGWLSPGHKNNHGSHSLNDKDLINLFNKISSQSLENFIEKYALDFTLCGYNKTLEKLKQIKSNKK